MEILDEKIANEVYDVLVMCGGALSTDRVAFIQAHTVKDHPCNEWRFQGHFRFGGKFYSHGWENEPWYIGYHPGDFMGDKNEDVYYSLMVAINTILISIWEKWKKGELLEDRKSLFSAAASERFSVTKDRGRFDAFVEGAEYGSSFNPNVSSQNNGNYFATLTLPDTGEDVAEVRLILPSKEQVHIGYKTYTGTVDVCVYESQDGSDKKAPGAPALRPKPVVTTCWTDKLDEHGNYASSMHPAPRLPNALNHERLATQLVLSVGPNHDLEGE